MSMMNRLGNAGNKYQGNTKRILCVCSAGLLRSPTIAHILSSPPWNFNTRAAGISKEYALVPVDTVLVSWAEDIVVVEPWMRDELVITYGEVLANTHIHALDVPDRFEYRDPYLVKLLNEALPKIYPVEVVSYDGPINCS